MKSRRCGPGAGDRRRSGLASLLAASAARTGLTASREAGLACLGGDPGLGEHDAEAPISRPGTAAFTLIELLVALAIVGMMLVALNTFVFSMGELWGRNTDYRIFHQHVAAVTRFLEEQLETATLPPSARAGSSPVMPVQVTPQNGLADNLITFDLPAGCRILPWAGRPLPEVTCSLQVRPGQGLYLLWHSRLETNYATDPPREMLLTPFCTGVAYDYYDDSFKRWTTETALRTDSNAQPELPQRLRLTFAYGKIQPFTVTIPVPATLQGLPDY